MNCKNPLISLEGFDYLFSFFNSKADVGSVKTLLESVFFNVKELDRKLPPEGWSRSLSTRKSFGFSVQQILQERFACIQNTSAFLNSTLKGGMVHRVFDFEHPGSSGETPSLDGKKGKVKDLRKSDQIKGMVGILHAIDKNPRNVLEIGSATGKMSAEIAKQLKNAQVVGVEIKEEDVIRAATDFREFSNLSFISADAFSFTPDNYPDITLSLHGCGSLTDRVIDIALESNAKVICAPCCYGVLRNENNKRRGYCLPRSLTLRKREKEFMDLLVRTATLESCGDTRRLTFRTAYRDLSRVLVNFDRLFYLKERGYEAGLARLTSYSGKTPDNRIYLNSPHSIVIFGFPFQQS